MLSMNLFIFGANWYNHGDESAIRSMIDEIRKTYPKSIIKIEFNQSGVCIPYRDIEVISGFTIPAKRRRFIDYLKYEYSVFTNWKHVLLDPTNYNKYLAFINAVQWCDYAIYAPGGPSFGDIYKQYYLVEMMHILHRYNKQYFFYAPSMGPFTKNRKRIKSALENSDFICLRESISKKYLRDLGVEKEAVVTLDSAFQHPFDANIERTKLDKYPGLENFISDAKCVGITITDLRWHDNKRMFDREKRIKESFEHLVKYLCDHGYRVLFIPQLFGKDNDAEYMKKFAINDCCQIVSQDEDCYFQQFVISKLYAVVGMRYHSNIFSAKEGTPFVSVAYEQKMSGFMDKAGLSQYCLSINDLNSENLLEKFKLLEEHYDEYKADLNKKRENFIAESHKTTEKLFERFQAHGLV